MAETSYDCVQIKSISQRHLYVWSFLLSGLVASMMAEKPHVIQMCQLAYKRFHFTNRPTSQKNRQNNRQNTKSLQESVTKKCNDALGGELQLYSRPLSQKNRFLRGSLKYVFGGLEMPPKPLLSNFDFYGSQHFSPTLTSNSKPSQSFLSPFTSLFRLFFTVFPLSLHFFSLFFLSSSSYCFLCLSKVAKRVLSFFLTFSSP